MHRFIHRNWGEWNCWDEEVLISVEWNVDDWFWRQPHSLQTVNSPSKGLRLIKLVKVQCIASCDAARIDYVRRGWIFLLKGILTLRGRHNRARRTGNLWRTVYARHLLLAGGWRWGTAYMSSVLFSSHRLLLNRMPDKSTCLTENQ